MQPNSQAADKLIILSLTLESAVRDENWQEVDNLLKARAAILDRQPVLSPELFAELSAIDERMLNELRKRLSNVKSDLRNLSAALRVASPYQKHQGPASLSLAG